MPPLQNPRHELFAQARASGATIANSYRASGGMGKCAKDMGKLFLSKKGVKERIAELQGLMAERVMHRALYTREDVIRGLLANVERAMAKVPVFDRYGKEVGVWRYDGPVVNRALELLGLELGMFPKVSKVSHRKDEDFERLGPEELVRFIHRNLEDYGWKVDEQLLRRALGVDGSAAQGGEAGLGTAIPASRGL